MTRSKDHQYVRTMYGPAPKVKDYGLDRRCENCGGKLSRYNPLRVCVLHTNAFSPMTEETERKCITCHVTKPMEEYRGPKKDQFCKSCYRCRLLNRQQKAEAAASGVKRVRNRARASDGPQTAPPAPAAGSQANTQPPTLSARKRATEGP